MTKKVSYPQKSDSKVSSPAIDNGSKNDPVFKYEDRYTSYGPRKKWGFYRPHEHHGFDNCDSNTGEILPSMTKQSEMDACDIHNVLKQFSPQGLHQLIAENQARGQYADVPESVDYQEALNTVIAAESAFATLPAKVRERFLNDPARFLEFMGKPENQDEAIAMGLATDTRPPPEPETPPTPPNGG